MRAQTILALVGIFALPIAHLGAQEPVSVISDPVGFNIVPCLPNSDTIVGVPFRQMGSFQATLDSDPQAIDDEASLPLRGPFNLTPDELSFTHYVKFTSGPLDGRWFTITGNSENTLTIDLNGDSLSSTTEGDSLLVAKFWTLDSLFPPHQATTAWTESPENSGNFIPNGHAIVASASSRPRDMMTRVFLPNLEAEGVNLVSPPENIFIVVENQWSPTNNSQNAGSTRLSPDSHLTIRHSSTVAHPTNYRTAGDVVSQSNAIALHTSPNGPQDNFIGLQRPIDLSLNELNLVESGAFKVSPSSRPRDLRDRLFVYDNSTPAVNRIASAIYFHDGQNWRNSTDNNSISDSAIIPASSGIMIRKFLDQEGTTDFWLNTPPF